MPRIRKIIPGVDPKLLIKDAAKLLPDPARRGVPARRLEPRRADRAHRLRHRRQRRRRRHACARFRKFNDRVQAWLFNPNTLAPEYPESAITRPFPFNGYYPEDEAPEVDGNDLQARSRRPDRQQGAVDAGAALRAAAGVADHPPRLRRRLERDRLVAGRAAVANSSSGIGADTRAKYVWFQCAEGYSNTIDMATALHPQTQLTLQVRQPDPAAQVRLPDEVPHADQARLQESEVHHGDLRAEQRRRRLLGEPGLQLVQRALAHRADQHHAADGQRGPGDQPRT